MNTTNPAATVQLVADRTAYRTIRGRSGMLSTEFNARVRALVHELADGEQATAAHYLRAAREIASAS